MIQTSKKSRLLIYIILVVFMIMSLYPFYMMLIMGTYGQYNLSESASMLPGGNLWENLKTVFEGGFLKYYGNSFYIAILTTVLAVFISALTGYGIAKFNFKLKRFLFIFVSGGYDGTNAGRVDRLLDRDKIFGAFEHP